MTQNIEKLTFIGRPYSSKQSDSQRSFVHAYQEMEADPVFQKFITDNDFGSKRANLLVFSTEDFMYWYGVVTNKDLKVPSGLLRYVLPKAEVAQKQIPDSSNAFLQPINTLVGGFLKQLNQDGVKYYQNLGDSPTPYILQELDDNKKLTQTLYLKASK